MTSTDGQILSLRRVTLLLGCLSLGLMGVLSLQAFYLFATDGDASSYAKAAGNLSLPQIPNYIRWPAIQGSPQAAFQLFSPPPVLAQTATELPAPTQPVDAESSFKLVAVVLGPNGRIALLESDTPADVIQAREGSFVKGWKLISIGSNQVSMERGGDRRLLYLIDTTPASP